MQVYDFSVPTNGSFPIGAVGRYIKYLSGNAGGSDPTIKVQAGRNGETAILMPGQALTFPASWNDFTLSSYAATQAIIGKVLIGNGRMDDATVQGLVQVVDGGKSRTLSNAAFGANGIQAAVAAQFSRVQLWNPVGSGKRLVVEAITVWSGVASNVYLTSLTAPVATLLGAGAAKLLGGVASAGQVYADTTAAPVYTNALASYPVVAAQLQVAQLHEPVVILPGQGLVGVSNVVNANMQINFEWYEEANV